MKKIIFLLSLLSVLLPVLRAQQQSFRLWFTEFSTGEEYGYKQTPQNEKLTVVSGDSLFRQVADFPAIGDTAKFLNDLQQLFGVDLHESLKQEQKITEYRKVQIYGSDKDYFFIEYDWKTGPMAEFPWKYQCLLSDNGKSVKVLSGQRFDFITIFPDQNPFLLMVVATAKGNGGHKLYKITDDTLENIYEGYYNDEVQTYDAHEDNEIYEPNELNLIIKDYNNDGFNDIAFTGKIVLIRGVSESGEWFDSEIIHGKTVTYSVESPFKKIPVEFVFLYDKQTQHFKAQANE